MIPGLYPLASGSKGNAYLLVSQRCKILIDAGLSGKAIKAKLAEINVDLSEISAILITHEHSDHVMGLKVLAMRHHIPVISNEGTAKGIYNTLGICPKYKLFTTGESFVYEDMQIHPFSIQHDTLDPVAFTIKMPGLKLGICTDLGFVSTLVRSHLRGCNYLLIEANHEPEMVYACSRPMIYKQRVLGRSGHLSNEACADLLGDILHEDLRHIHLAHLSEECNSPTQALQKISEKIVGSKATLDIAHQAKISEPALFS